MEMIDLTPVLLAWIGLLASLITARLIPWLKNRTTLQNWEAEFEIVGGDNTEADGGGEA